MSLPEGCRDCMLEKNRLRAPAGVSDERREEFIRLADQIVLEGCKARSSPEITRDVLLLREEMFGIRDDYSKINRHFNELMLGVLPGIKSRIDLSEDPLGAALRYALMGNYIDFGALKNVSEEELMDLLSRAEEMELDEETVDLLRKRLREGRDLVYMTDNCGEIVMDRLLIEQMQKDYPHLRIAVLVRGAEVLNDATMEDARFTGLTGVCRVVSNESPVAGNCLTGPYAVGETAKALIEKASLILAKGQGNFESLSGSGLDVFYLFLCKCELFRQRFQAKKFTPMIVHMERS